MRVFNFYDRRVVEDANPHQVNFHPSHGWLKLSEAREASTEITEWFESVAGSVVKIKTDVNAYSLLGDEAILQVMFGMQQRQYQKYHFPMFVLGAKRESLLVACTMKFKGEELRLHPAQTRA